jgi:hypothetical protein
MADDAVSCELVSAPNSPANREINLSPGSSFRGFLLDDRRISGHMIEIVIATSPVTVLAC